MDYIALPGQPASFRLTGRSLKEDEQLDLSMYNDGDQCGNFVTSFKGDLDESCHKCDNIKCFHLWNNGS